MPNKKHVEFPSTTWTDIARWEQASAPERRGLIERFYVRYKPPLLNYVYSFLADKSQAEDALHDFMLSHMEGRIFLAADPRRGRFRSLLLRSLKNHMISSARFQQAAKRRPGPGFLALDDEILDGISVLDLVSANESVEDAYNRIWLATVLSNVLDRLRVEYVKKDQDLHYQLFQQRVIAPILSGERAPGYDKLADEHGLTAAQASNFVITAKRAYKRLLKAEIREYAGSEKEVAEEINDFLYFLQNLRS